MAQQTVITQTALSDIKLVLNDIAASLSQHINDSLSMAHGINLWPGFIDAFGNDFTTFRNQNGDIVGNFIVSFLIDGVMYFAPANHTSLQPQPFTNGNIQVTETNPLQSVGASWVTDFAAAALASTEAIRDDVLVPHTQLGHWEVHGDMQVIPQNTFDTNGFLVSRFVILFNFAGQLYQIPCDTNPNGAPQGLSVAISSTFLYFPSSSGSFAAQHPSGFPVTATASGGTGPYTFTWFYLDDANSNPAGQQMTTSPISFNPSLFPSVAFTISTVSPFSVLNILSITNHLPGSGSKNFFFWATVTDAASNTATSPTFRIQFFHG